MGGLFRRHTARSALLATAVVAAAIGASSGCRGGADSEAPQTLAGGFTWMPYTMGSNSHVYTVDSVVPGGPGYVGLCGHSLCSSTNGVHWVPSLSFRDRNLVLWSIVRGPDGLLMDGFRNSNSDADLQGELYRSGDGVAWIHVPTSGPNYRLVAGRAGFVGQYSAGGAKDDWLLWSADGMAWTVSDFRTDGAVIDLWATSTAYFATERASGDRLWRSTDGRHWTLVEDGMSPCRGLAEAPDGSLVVLRLVDLRWCELAVSRDTGVTWESAATNGLVPEFNRPMSIGGKLVALGDFDVWSSPDGVNWEIVTPPAIEHHAMWLLSLGDAMLVVGPDSQAWIGRPASG